MRAIERELSVPAFRGVPMGSAVASVLMIDLYAASTVWGLKTTLKDRARLIYHHLRPIWRPPSDVSACRGRILVTWFDANFRLRDLVLPVARQLGPDRCAMLFPKAEMGALLPLGVPGVTVPQLMHYDRRQWRRDYRDYVRQLKPVLARVARQFNLAAGFCHRLRDAVLTGTQQVAGFLEFLDRARPSAVVTEFDRHIIWAPLVLAARGLGIPTFSVVHGVIGEKCVGFYPLLADEVFCWGEMDRDKFLAAGLDPARAVVAGCPRLSRETGVSAAAARTKIGLDPARPVVLLATDPIAVERRLRLAEVFCRAVRDQDRFSPVVRLHPVEKLPVYAELAARFPRVRFTTNETWTLDESLAAAEVVVVNCSGAGSDALVKRRLTVVLDVVEGPLGHGQDLIDLANCPRATSAEDLRAVLAQLLDQTPERQRCEQSREKFVARFCADFGQRAAARIAEHILRRLGLPGEHAPRAETSATAAHSAGNQ
jgi:hypothetical protein